MSNNIEKEFRHLEFKLNSKLSKRELVNVEHDFKVIQKINNSNVISLKTVPDITRIPEEDMALDFSTFALSWQEVDNRISTSCASSESGKFQIISNFYGGLYVSLDFGYSWALTETPTYEPIYLDNQIVDYKDDTIYQDVAISADGRYYTAVSFSEIFKSNNHLESWTIADISLTNIKSITMSASGKIQYLSCDEGIYTSNDFGNSWNNINNIIYKVRCSSNGQYLVTSNNDIDSIILYSEDYGITFNLSDSPKFKWVDSKCSGTGQYQTSITDSGKIYISDNYGKNWKFSTENYDILNSVTMSGSGKYRLAVGNNVYISKNFGLSWKELNIGNDMINFINLSFDGKVAILSSNKIYSSIINTNYIKETGVYKFKPLNSLLFGTFNSIHTLTNLDIITNNTIDYTELINDIGTNNSKIAVSKTGKFISIVVENGYIFSSVNFGKNFIKYNGFETPKNWSSIGMSSSGKYQIAIVKTGEVWRSDDNGQLWFQIPSTSSNNIGAFNLNDVVLSSLGKYQTICGDGGNIIYSNNYGYNWISTTICSDNLTSIAMSDDGRYQSVCGINSNSNSNMYSKTYGINWRYSTLPDSNIQWNSISCSECGQYQSMCTFNEIIITSQDYGITWNNSLSGNKSWKLIFVTLSGQKQLACDYGGDIYLSDDFGYTWNSCYTSTNNWMSIGVSDTLQYTFAIYNNGMLISSIINDDMIPGVIIVPTKFNTNPHSIILISGTGPNIYSYETNFTTNFGIISSDLDDEGYVSYAVISYGETFN